ncbi:hypothetical protein V7139_17470 [Neobacillus drentensis]
MKKLVKVVAAIIENERQEIFCSLSNNKGEAAVTPSLASIHR